MTITPPTPATPATPAPEKTLTLTPQRKINKPRGEPGARAGVAAQPQKVASDETNWRTKSPNQAAGWDGWQSRREKGGPDRDKWKYIMPASLITTPIPDLTPSEEPDNKFSTPKKVPTLTPQRTMRRSLEQIQKATASSPLCPPPPMPRSAYKTSPGPKQKDTNVMSSPPPSASKYHHKERVPVVEKEKFEAKDLEQAPAFDASDFPTWNPDEVNSLWDTLSASKESAIYDVRTRHTPGSTEEKVKRPLFTTSDDDTSRPSTPRRNRSGSVSPERVTGSSGEEFSSPNFSAVMTTPLKKTSGSTSEPKCARSSGSSSNKNNNNNKNNNKSSQSLPRRRGSIGSVPHSSLLPSPSVDMDADIANFESNHVINSPNFDDNDDENNNSDEGDNRLSSSPLPMRDISAIIADNTHIADLSPIAPTKNDDEQEEEEEEDDVATQLSKSSNKSHPSPLATRAIQPFPTFTIEEASIEGDSPVSEKKQSKTPPSPLSAPSPSAFSSSSPQQPQNDYASSECFAALASSNNANNDEKEENYLPPTTISFSPSPALRPSITPITSCSPQQHQQSSSSPIAPAPLTPSSPPFSLRSFTPVQAQPVPLLAPATSAAVPEVMAQVQGVQPIPSGLVQMATMGGVVNAFLIVFIAVLFAFLLTDFF